MRNLYSSCEPGQSLASLTPCLLPRCDVVVFKILLGDLCLDTGSISHWVLSVEPRLHFSTLFCPTDHWDSGRGPYATERN